VTFQGNTVCYNLVLKTSNKQVNCPLHNIGHKSTERPVEMQESKAVEQEVC
jgi:hypothetical protein